MNETTPKEYFMNAYIDECFESDNIQNTIKIMCTILYAKFKNNY